MEDLDFALGLIEKLSFGSSDKASTLGMDYFSRIEQINLSEINHVGFRSSHSMDDLPKKGLFLVPRSVKELAPEPHCYSDFQYYYADLSIGFDLKFKVDCDHARASGNLLAPWEIDLIEKTTHASINSESLAMLSKWGRIKTLDGINIVAEESPVKAILSLSIACERSSDYSVNLRFQTRDQTIGFDLNEIEHVFSSGLVQVRNRLFFLDDRKITPLVLDLFLYGPIRVHEEKLPDFLRQTSQRLRTANWVLDFEPRTVICQKAKPILYFRAQPTGKQTVDSFEFMQKAKIYLAFRYENEERISDIHDDAENQPLPLEFNFVEGCLRITMPDYRFEKECKRSLSQSFAFNHHRRHWKVVVLDGLDKKIWKLIEAGYEVWVEKIKVDLLDKFDLETNSTINWFDAQIKDGFTGENLNIVELINYLKRKRVFLRVGSGKLYILPEKWVQTLHSLLAKGIVINDSVMRFSNLWSEDIEAKKSEFTVTNDDSQLLESAKAIKNARKPQPIQQINGFRGELRTYQLEGVSWLEFLHSCHCGGILADDMGLGKTVQMIAFLYKKMISERDLEHPLVALIVTPKSVLHHWAREIESFAPGIAVTDLKSVLHAQMNNQKIARVPTVILSTYGMVLHHEQLLETVCFDFVILDEAQLIKNSFSRISQAVKNLKAESRFALTGTPIENRLSELVNIIEFLNPLLRLPHLEKASLPSDLKAQTIKLFKPLILRRLKKDLLTDLPEKIETTLYLPMDAIQKDMHSHWFHQAQLQYQKAQKDAGQMPAFLEALLRLRQAAILPSLWAKATASDKITSGKLRFLEAKIPELIENRHKMVVFSQFVGFLKAIAAILEKKKISFAYFDGSTEDRETHISHFQTDESCRVLLASLKAGGTGISLTSADVCFISDPWWNPAVEQQAMDRLYRIGQKKTVHIFRMVSKDSIEEKMLDLKNKKADLIKEIPVSEPGFLDLLNPSDFQDFFA